MVGLGPLSGSQPPTAVEGIEWSGPETRHTGEPIKTQVKTSDSRPSTSVSGQEVRRSLSLFFPSVWRRSVGTPAGGTRGVSSQGTGSPASMGVGGYVTGDMAGRRGRPATTQG